MGMNPDTNRFEELHEPTEQQKDLLKKFTANIPHQPPTDENVLEAMAGRKKLLRPDGSPVPEHWSVFRVGEEVVVKNYTFKIGYIGESTLLLEPVRSVVIGENENK